MKLELFSATNYRSITSAHKISLSKNTVLLGKNNEGKSNFLRALQTAMLILQAESRATNKYRSRTLLGYDIGYVWLRDFPIQLQGRKSVKQTILKIEFLFTDDECLELKELIGSAINGSLAIEIKIGMDNLPTLKVVKSGKGAKALSQKIHIISKFIAQRIHFNYIPAVRTDSETVNLISSLLSQELKVLEARDDYLQALSVIAKLQGEVLQQLSEQVQIPLKEFLPNLKSVKIEISDSSRRHSLRNDVSIWIDDGTPTLLEHKGDGVKSLAALGLLKNRVMRPGTSVLAIEEPESHLHPSAIHQVNEIIRSIAEDSQVIVTTHNPLFVDRAHIKSNVLITNGGASVAKNIQEIRDLLGVRASDNLTNANFALLVEGEEDVISLSALLPVLSDKLAKALKLNFLIIEPVGGAGNFPYKISLLKNSLCAVHVLADADAAGKESIHKAVDSSLITEAEYTLTNCKAMPEAEFEDCIDPLVYKQAVLDNFGVDLNVTTFRGSGKWSKRIKETFGSQGKDANEKLITKVKFCVANSVAQNPRTALHSHKRPAIDSLVQALERLIKG